MLGASTMEVGPAKLQGNEHSWPATFIFVVTALLAENNNRAAAPGRAGEEANILVSGNLERYRVTGL